MNLSELTTAVGNTLAVCGLCIALAFPLGSLLSLLLVRTNIWGKRLLWIALGSQLAVPLYAFAGSWSAGFGLQGWLNPAGWLGPAGIAWMQSPLGSLLAVSLIHALFAIPWVCLIISLGLLWSDRGQEETALVEAGWPRVLRHVVLPRLRPWLLVSTLWCVLPVLTEMVVTNLYQVPTVAEQVYLDASRGALRPLTYVAAVGLCMLPLAGLAWLSWRWCPPWHDVIRRAQHARAVQLDLRGWRFFLSLCVWSIVGLLVGMPILNLLAKAGWQPRVTDTGLTTYGWSWTRLKTTATESLTLFVDEFQWTALLALLASGLALGLACGLFHLAGRRGRWWAGAGMLLLIAVPGPLVGMLLIWLFNRSRPALLGQLYDGSLLVPVLAQQFRLLPLAWLLVVSLMATISRETWELASVDGLSRWQRLRFILAPQTWSRWLAAGLLLAVMSVGELSSTILVLPNGVTTVSKRLFELLHFGMRHQDSGLCGLLLLLGWGVSFVFWKTLRDR